MIKKHHYKTIWLSDIHLGSIACKAENLLRFLNDVKADNIYLVGDIIDGWALKRKMSPIPQDHLNVIRSFLSKAKKGANVFYVVGNHDEFIREFYDFFPIEFGNITIANEFEYTTTSGERILIVHGDLYDCITQLHRWVAVLGDLGYTILVHINHWFNVIRQKIGYPYWSISNYAKQKIKKSIEFINNFENVIVLESKRRGFDGVICGHIHTPTIKQKSEVTYYNTGDWVENCTFLVEHFDGGIELIAYEN